jgi:hypothetical protein
LLRPRRHGRDAGEGAGGEAEEATSSRWSRGGSCPKGRRRPAAAERGEEEEAAARWEEEANRHAARLFPGEAFVFLPFCAARSAVLPEGKTSKPPFDARHRRFLVHEV